MFRFAQHDHKSTVILRDDSPEESLRCFASLNMTIQGTVILSLSRRISKKYSYKKIYLPSFIFPVKD